MTSSCSLGYPGIDRELDELESRLRWDEALPLADAMREWRLLQRRLSRRARAPRERQYARQQVAMRVLLLMGRKSHSWEEYARSLRHVRRLGYISVEHQLSVASSTLEWISRCAPERAALGWTLLREAERRVRRLPRKHFQRDAGLDVIAMTHRRVARRGLLSP